MLSVLAPEDNPNSLPSNPQIKEADALMKSREETLAIGSLEEKKAALEDVKKALAIYIKYESLHEYRRGNALGTLCSVYRELEDLTNGIKYCQEIVNLEKEKGYDGSAYSQELAKIYVKTKDYKNAINTLQDGLNMMESAYRNGKACQLSPSECEGVKKQAKIGLLKDIGKIHFLAENYSESVKYYQEVINYCNNDCVSYHKTDLGHALLRTGNILDAEKFLLIALRDTKADTERFNNMSRSSQDIHNSSLQFNIQGVTNRVNQQLYQALQELRVKQGRFEEALNVSEEGRTGGISSFLSSQGRVAQVEALTFLQVQDVAREQNATLVNYSIIGNQEIFIWVIQPDGKLHFRQVNLSSLSINGLSNGFEPTNIFKIVVLVTGIAASVIFLKRRKKLVILGIVTSLIVAVLLPFRETQLASINQDSTSSSSNQSRFSLANLTQTTFASIRGKKRGVLSESLGKGTCQDSDDCLERMHKLLIQPISDLLPQKPDEQVIFIPHGELFRVPFAALKDKDGKYLIEKHTLRTSYSIQILKQIRQQAQKKSFTTTTEALVVGNPIMPKVAFNLNSPAEQIDSLPATEKEAKAVAQLLGTNPLIGKQATESTVVNKISDAKLIHLATHGFLNVRKVRHLSCDIIFPDPGDGGEAPPNSFKEYAFTPKEGSESYSVYDQLLCYKLSDVENPGVDVLTFTSSKQDDGLLNEIEIYKLNLNAKLVVLSACDTGLGEITSDGVVGLARPFIARGVPSVVVSLWQVPDAPTSELMVDFYNNLKSNPDKAQALRQAMLTTMKKHPDPFNWAAFTLVGEAQ